MTMRYRQNKERSKIFAALCLLAVGALVLSFGRGRELFERAASPIFALNASAGDILATLSDETKSRSQLEQELGKLREENKELYFENLNQQVLKGQIKELKEELGLEERDEEYSLSRVIARPPVTPFDSLTINTSGNERVEKGQRVLAAETVEIGRVSSVKKTSAVISLYTSAGTRTPVEINGDGPLVIAEGAGGGSFILHVPRSFDVKKGDLLTRPGKETTVLGIIEGVEKSETDAFSLVRARLPINMFEVSWVYTENSSTE